MDVTRGIFKRVDAEIAAGRIWRAKEVLRGALASNAHPALLERYGRLLDSLGERYEAGKYLYLSGERAPEYAAAIELFLSRNSARAGADFVGLFPAAVRRLPFEQLPARLQEDLRSRGVPPMRFSGERPLPSVRYTWGDRARMVAAVVIAGIFVLSLALGMRQILNWSWKFLFE